MQGPIWEGWDIPNIPTRSLSRAVINCTGNLESIRCKSHFFWTACRSNSLGGNFDLLF